MKYVITESKLFDVIYQYFDDYLNINEIDLVYGPSFDDDGYFDNDIENEDYLIFYTGGDWNGEENTDIVFNYFTVNYYKNEFGSWKDKAPILEVMGGYGEHLDNLFNEQWKKPMAKWFQNNFNLPVKTVSTYY